MTAGTKPDADPRDALSAELSRVAEAFRRMPHSKLAARLEPYGDRARAGHWLASQLAAVAQGMAEWRSPLPPRWRKVPALGPFALGDQIAVTGSDLLDAYDALMREAGTPAGTQVWTPGDGRIPADKVLAAVLESTTALRLVL
jgi:hypothetical protein